MTTRPIEKKYCEGKVKRTLKRGSKALEIVIRKTYTAGNWSRGVQVRLCAGPCKRAERLQTRSAVRGRASCLSTTCQHVLGQAKQRG